MTELIDLDTWLGYLGDEYFRSYIPEGGAAVKIAVAEADITTQEIVEGIRACASQAGLTAFTIDSHDVKLHMIDRVFFACAAQVPWTALTDFVLRRFAADEGFALPAAVPPGASFAHALAASSGTEVDYVRQRLNQSIHEYVYRDRAMVRDFRLAMTSLCKNRLTGSESAAADSAVIEQWLTGRLARMSELKRMFIYTRINRTNARLHLESLFHWIRVARVPGTALVIDLGHLVDGGVGKDFGERYSRAALLDAYEVLRQFIDSIDELEGVMLVGVAGPNILDPDRRSRGLVSYQALRNRVYDEVRDRTHANPVGSLVRVEGYAQ
jgi:hypothetical protein